MCWRTERSGGGERPGVYQAELGAAATPASGERWADLSDECGEAGRTGQSASRTEPSSVEAETSRETYGPVDSTSAIRIIADAWADLVSNDEDAKAQQLLTATMEHPGVNKETLREALLDTVRQRSRGGPRRTESDDNSWKRGLERPSPEAGLGEGD